MAAGTQRGQMKPVAPGKWQLRIYTGQRDGKNTYASKVFSGTTSQARQALTQMHREKDTGTLVVASKQTVTEYLDTWLAGKLSLSPKSRVSYGHQMLHVKAALGSIRLTDLSKPDVQGLVRLMVERELSPRSVRYTVRIFRSAIDDAIGDGLLVRNPVSRIELPASRKRGATVLSAAQVHLLLEKTAGTELHALWLTLLTTGLRPEEAFGLKWSDVELDAGWVSVRRTLVSDGKGGVSLCETVKADSQRRIGIGRSTIDTLRGHKRTQREAIVATGPNYERLDLVFANRYGRPVDIARVRRCWKAALASCELPAVRLYDTRHTHLTLLLADGADIAWVANRAGHKDISMTRDHYAHVLQETQRGMGEQTERILAAAKRAAEA